MEKPLFTLTSKDFLSGIAPSAHIQGKGLFFKADGVTPLYEPGNNQSVNNGLLMAGASGTLIPGTLTGSIIASARSLAGSSNMFFSTDDGYLWSWLMGNFPSSALSSIRNVTGLRSGLEVFGAFLFYFQQSQIGRYDLASSYTDNWQTITAEQIHATHIYQDTLYFGNGQGVIGKINSAYTPTTSAFQFYSQHICTDISDDGTYIALAITDNVLADTTIPVSDTRILWWDGQNTNQFAREYLIPDPFIYRLEKTSFGLFAYGVTGIWQVSFDGVKQVLWRSPGVYSTSGSGLKYGRAACSFYSNALSWGGTSGTGTIRVAKTLGKLDGAYENAVLHPFLLTANKNITYLDGQALKGYLLVGDSTPQLKAYPFSLANAPQTGVSAQTIYLQLPYPAQINRVRVVFGEPIANGDSLTISASSDEDTSATTFGTISYASHGAVRSKSVRPSKNLEVEDQLSLSVSFGGGTPKIKKIEVFGQPTNNN